MNRHTLRFKLVMLAMGAALLAQLVAGALLIQSGMREAELRARHDLDSAERIAMASVGQMREQGMLAAILASRDAALTRAATTGDSAAAAAALLSRGRKIGVGRAWYVRADGTVVGEAQVSGNEPPPLRQDAAIRAALAAGRGSGIVIRGEDTLLWVVGTAVPEAGGVVFVSSIKRRLATELSVLPEVQATFGSPSALAARKVSDEGANDQPSPWSRRLYLTESGPDAVALLLAVRPPEALQVAGDSALLWGLAALLAAAIAGGLAYLLGGRWMAPAGRLRAAVERVSGGEYLPVRSVHPRSELGALAQSFNTMIDGLQARERRILQTAYRDPLTSLPNRTLFQERLAEAVSTARRTKRPLSVLLVDLDQFKSVNESLGHAAGDTLLQEVAERIRRVMRGADSMIRLGGKDGGLDKGTQPTLARLGGDDFAVLLPGCSADQGQRVASRLLDTMRRPFTHDGQTVLMGATIGVAAFPEHALDVGALSQAADTALYEAKSRRLGVVSFDIEHERNREQHLSLLSDLKRALERNELSLQFQPKVSLKGEPRLMVEALLRWIHPERGPQNPATFVPFAEKTGFIATLTRWVLDRALAQSAKWYQAGLDVQVGVNVSAHDLASEDFTTYVVERLRHHGLRPDMLTIEVNESAIVREPHAARACLEILDRLGVKLAIDDFGTGFSSLNYLRELPVDAVKIDRSFIAGLIDDPGNRVIVKSTIDLAHSLRMKAIAEGVETPEILAELRTMGCDYAQGYYFGKPLSADDFASWVEHQARRFSGTRGSGARTLRSVQAEPRVGEAG